MTPSFATRGSYRHRYYVCTGAQKRGWQVCQAPSVPADQIERLVIGELFAIGGDPELISEALDAWRRGQEDDTERLEASQMAAALRQVESAWPSASPAQRAAMLRRILSHVVYDAGAKEIALKFCPEGIRQLATQADGLAAAL